MAFLRAVAIGAALAIATPSIATTSNDALVQNVAAIVTDSSAERIEAGELLRVYSQEVAAAACFLYNGIDKNVSKELLTEARLGFDKNVDALLHGNASMGIGGPEDRRKTIVLIENVATEWRPIAEAVDVLLSDPTNKDAVGVIKARNVPLLDLTDILVSELETTYSNPAEIMQVDLLMMEIAGRQAMMTQKIAKNACKIWSGNASAEINAALGQSMQIYERSLDALINGMPELGIKPAPTPEILESLSHVRDNYAEVKPLLVSLLAGEDINREDLIELFHHMEKEMHELEEITHAYAVFSKHVY